MTTMKSGHMPAGVFEPLSARHLRRRRHMSGGLQITSLVALATAASFWTTAATAQQAGTQQAAQNAMALEEIVVTSTRRAERLQDVALSVSAMSEAQLQRQGVNNFTDFASKIPALGFNNSGGPTFETLSIRGVGIASGGQASAGSAPTVAVYMDETPVSPPFSRNSSAQPVVFDIDRIEVLRGPQGTLFGASSMGGTIRYITNKPNTREVQAKIVGELSQTAKGGENIGLNAMVNIPLVEDKLALRTVVTYRQDSGYIDRLSPALAGGNGLPNGALSQVEEDVNSSEVRGARIMARWTPTDRLTITPTFATQDIEQDSAGSADTNLPRFQQMRYVDEPQSAKFDYYNLMVEYDAGVANLISSTSYLDRNTREVSFFGNILAAVSGVTLNDLLANTDRNDLNSDRVNPQKMWVQEVRLQSSGDQALQWIVGAFYLHQKGGENQNLLAPSYVAYGKQLGVLDPAGPGFAYVESTRTKEEQLAFFGDLTYAITPALEASVGLRWTDVKRSSDAMTDGALFGAASEDRRESFSPELTPRFNVSWHVTADRMIYATAAKGFRTGIDQTPITAGPCLQSIRDLGIDPTQSGRVNGDSLWSYEIGAKTGWLDNRLIVNGSAYYIKWKDIQQTVNLTCGSGFVANAGATDIKGFELEITGRLSESFDFSFGAGYSNAKVGSEGQFDIPDQEPGDRVPEIPRWTVAAGAQYSFPVMDRWSGYLRADLSWRDRIYQDYARSAALTRPSHFLGSARLGVEMEAWEAVLFVDNIFNEYIVQTYDPSGSEVRPGRPRTWGLRVQYRY